MSTHRLCPWWFAYTFDHPLRRFIHDPEQILTDYVKPGMTALDLGCGLGYFTIPMARLVGEAGRVIAIDIQHKGLQALMRRARKAGVDTRISPCLCTPDTIGVQRLADFALAFFMLHETPDPPQYLRQIHGALRPGALLLLAEPKFHVSKAEFARALEAAQDAGFYPVDRPHIRISHTALLRRGKAQE